jgi:hypothetical protein
MPFRVWNFIKVTYRPKHGGRLSSLLDVQMKEGSTKKFTGKGGVSPIASRLTVEVPTVKGKGSLVVAGRRTYMDLFTGLANDEALQSSTLYFYDFNVKSHLKLDEKNTLYISGYMGRDKFGVDLDEFSPSMDWGNISSTLRWKHIFHQNLVSNLSLNFSKYDYRMGFRIEDFDLDWKADITDYGIRWDFDYFISQDHNLSFGITSTLHGFKPGNMRVQTPETTGTPAVERCADRPAIPSVAISTTTSVDQGEPRLTGPLSHPSP